MSTSDNATWEQVDARVVAAAENPDRFIQQQLSPLFFQRTYPSAGDDGNFEDEQAFWQRSTSLPLSSVCLHNFHVSNWFPRAPGVYWSVPGQTARAYVWSAQTVDDPRLGRIFNPRSKMALIEDGGIGTIRLLPRRIDQTDCWLATAVSGPQCAGGVPLAVPDAFLREAKIGWGDTATIYGQVRFLKEAGLDDTAAYVRHASPIIVFVQKIVGAPARHRRGEPVTLTPVALFDRRATDDQTPLGYTFVQCVAGSDDRLVRASTWISDYAEKYSGQVITNFDEMSPILADAPLSYQRLVTKKYDRYVIEKLTINGGLLAERIDLIENLEVNYNNYGQVGAFGPMARSDGNTFASKPTIDDTPRFSFLTLLKRTFGRIQ